MRHLLPAFVLFVLPSFGSAQQVVDSSYHPTIPRPAYTAGRGPVVALDSGHYNFHTRTGRYLPFARILETDGYRVQDLGAPFTAETLAGIDILVIANAGISLDDAWRLPARSAFTSAEIDAVYAWVANGGSLFLIADHMPAAGAAADLARRFGAEFTNGYTVGQRAEGMTGDRFTRRERTILDHPITLGRTPAERVDTVVTFTGQAFQVDSGLATLLRFGPNTITWLPVRAGQPFDSLTPNLPTAGWTHAAAGTFGRGRVVLLGEAGGLSAQLGGPDRVAMGLNRPEARPNLQFLLNVLHWLSRLVD